MGVVIDSPGYDSNTGVESPPTSNFDVTVSSNPNRAAAMAVWGPNAGMTATIGGNAFPQIQYQDYDGFFGLGLFFVVNPAPGVNTVTFSAGNFQVSFLALMSGVKQNSTPEASNKNFATGAQVATSLTTLTPNALVLGACASGGGWSGGTNWNLVQEDTASNTVELASFGPVASPGVVTMTAGDAGGNNAMVMLAVAAAVGSRPIFQYQRRVQFYSRKRRV